MYKSYASSAAGADPSGRLLHDDDMLSYLEEAESRQSQAAKCEGRSTLSNRQQDEMEGRPTSFIGRWIQRQLERNYASILERYDGMVEQQQQQEQQREHHEETTNRRRATLSNSNRMIENLSEFLATRNVINPAGRTTRSYDRLLNSNNNDDDDTQEVHRDEEANQDKCHNVRCSRKRKFAFNKSKRLDKRKRSIPTQRAIGEVQQLSLHQQQQQQHKPLKYNSSGKLSSSSSKQNFDRHGNKVKVMLKALINPKYKNKTRVLIKLLKTPSVLAALFSLALVASLMVLFVTHDHKSSCHLQQQQQQQQQERQSRKNLSTSFSTNDSLNNPIGTDGTVFRQQQQQQHHINSRHLMIQPVRICSNTETTSPSPSTNEVSEKFTSHKQQQQQQQDEARDYYKALNSKRALTVQTECGAYVGSPEHQGFAFRGIAYATPPVDQRRWQRPRYIWHDEQLCKFNESRDAYEQRDHCAQLSPVTRRFSGKEDCLYLDIFTPQLNDPTKKLPVMVYIHGGWLTFGSSVAGQAPVNWLKATPSTKLASELEVVFVRFNYRLQVLGFMRFDSPPLIDQQDNGPDRSEANYGLWDQLAAINWVKRNIEPFGGDSNNIVLFGPDAASVLPLALLSERRNNNDDENEAAGERDLFRAVWLTNPVVFFNTPTPITSGSQQSSGGRGGGSTNNLLTSLPFICSNCNSSSSSSSGSSSISGSQISDDGAKITNPSTNIMEQSYHKCLQECLFNLSAEQVVRHYLGDEDPADRLDNQNSLPVHGVFANQLVTIDQELVQDYYPFVQSTATTASVTTNNNEEETKLIDNDAQAFATIPPPPPPAFAKAELVGGTATINSHYNFSVQLKQTDPQSVSQSISFSLGSLMQLEGTNESSITGFHKRPNATNATNLDDTMISTTSCTTKESLACKLIELHKGTHQAHHSYTTNHVVNGTGGSTTNYTDDKERTYGVKKVGQEYYSTMATHKRQKSRLCLRKKDLLIGSTAQAVEFWPNPKDQDQWDWSQFQKYVSTSLNSFGTQAFTNAQAIYGFPAMSSNDSNGERTSSFIGRDSPKKVYLTMVSDVRQICPVNEVAENIKAQGHEVTRYVVETHPRLLKHKLNTKRPEYSYHGWDLFAFFGFEFDKEFIADESDVRFQYEIRKMVKRFAHGRRPYLLSSQKSTTLLTTLNHRQKECKMWEKNVGKSYAWIS